MADTPRALRVYEAMVERAASVDALDLQRVALERKGEALAQMAGKLPDHQSVFINNIVYRY